MKRLFLVEADTSYESLFCYELEHKGYEDEKRKFLQREKESLFANIDRSQFFGNLNSLCQTHQRVQAPPIPLAEPKIDPPAIPQHVTDFLATDADLSGGPCHDLVDDVMARTAGIDMVGEGTGGGDDLPPWMEPQVEDGRG